MYLKPPNMTWGTYVMKHFELTPLWMCTAFGMGLVVGIIVRFSIVGDYQGARHVKYPWDRRNLLRQPYTRKILEGTTLYDDRIKKLYGVYREMDRKVAELEKQQAEKRKKC